MTLNSYAISFILWKSWKISGWCNNKIICRRSLSNLERNNAIFDICTLIDCVFGAFLQTLKLILESLHFNITLNCHRIAYSEEIFSRYRFYYLDRFCHRWTDWSPSYIFTYLFMEVNFCVCEHMFWLSITIFLQEGPSNRRVHSQRHIYQYYGCWCVRAFSSSWSKGSFVDFASTKITWVKQYEMT